MSSFFRMITVQKHRTWYHLKGT